MLTKLTDIAASAISNLISLYREKEKFPAIVGQLGARVQELEDALFALVDMTAIATATGVWLDYLGAIVGEARDGASDADYRRFISARVRVLRSQGTVEDLLAVLDAWNGSSLATVVTEYFPAGIEVQVPGVVALAGVGRFLRMLKATRAAGVGQMVLYQSVADADAFTFSSSSAPEASAAQGFSDTANPTTGGSFVGAELT